MAAKRRSVFKHSVDKKSVAVKIDPEVHNDLEALEKRLEQFGEKLTLDRSQIFEDALRNAIREGNNELDNLQKQRQAT